MRTSNRKPLRCPEYDYSAAGYYFVTVCTVKHMCLLGDVGAGHLAGPAHDMPTPNEGPCFALELTEYGKIVERYIRQIPQSYPNASIDKYVVMPNHIHLILQLKREPPADERSEPGPCEEGPARCPAPTSVPKIISALKSLTSRAIGIPLWQRSYHDHIIRNEADYVRIWQYIDENPAKWAEDRYYTMPGEWKQLKES